jgi:hypothetical protein
MSEFVIPVHYEDLLTRSSERFCVQKELNVAAMAESTLTSTLAEILDTLESLPFEITKNQVFDPLYSCIK